jgi:hypothetical protein
MKKPYKFSVEPGTNYADVIGKLILNDPSDEWNPFVREVKIEILKHKKFIINFRIEGMSSNNNMYIMNLAKYLDNLVISGKKDIVIKWYYLDIDEDMLEYGEEIKMEMKNIKFELIPVEGNVLNPQ